MFFPMAVGILFTRRINQQDEVVSFSLETGVSEVLFAGQTARYAPTGHVVFVTPEATLAAAPF